MPKKQNRKTGQNNELIIIALISSAVLLIVGVGTWWAYVYSTDMVRSELSSQKMFFPKKGSPAISPEEYPGLQQYAGMQVDDGYKARAYAKEYIGHHLEKIAAGKTYAEVSSEAMKNPKDEKLASQKQQLFMGETLRGLLLNAYAFWTIGKLLQIVSIISVLFGSILILFAVRSIRKNS